MKYRSFSLLVWALLSASVFGQNLDLQEAQVIAERFLVNNEFVNQAKTRGMADRTISRHALIADNEKPSFYAFNCEGNNGFVLVAADARISEPVIGFSDSGAFEPETMNDEQKGWLEIMKRSLANFAEESPSQTRAVSYHDPVPMLIDAEWNQGYPYNIMCPKDEKGNNYVTGCVITAMAQVMYYHKWPEQGQGEHSYTCKTAYGQPELYADFSKSTYRWDQMTPKYDKKSSEESCNAVALLMKDLGIAVEAEYGGKDGTGASQYKAMIALKKFFDFDRSMNCLLRGFCTLDYFEQTILSDLRAGRPILIAGSNDHIGHEYILDGFNSEGYYHVNFGWGGNSNGYYKMGSFGYDLELAITHGIKKNEGGKDTFSSVCVCLSTQDFYYDYKTQMFSESCILICIGDKPLIVFVALAVENLETGEIKYNIVQESRMEGLSDNGSNLVYPYKITNELEDGDYIVYPVASSDLEREWRKFMFKNSKQEFVDLKVKNGEYNYTNNHIVNILDEGKVEIDGKYFILNKINHTASLTYFNNTYNSYSGDLVIPSSVFYEGITYTVNSIGELACYNCKNLTSVFLPASIEKIEYNGIANCESLKQIIFEENSRLNRIVELAIHDNSNLETLEIPEGVESIGDYLSSNCHSLKTVSLPSTLKEIGEIAFGGESLLEIKVADGCSILSDIDGVLFNKDQTILLKFPAAKPHKEYIIPNSVTEIGNGAFSGSKNLTKIIIPNSVKTIGEEVFYRCENLTGIEIPNSVTTIGEQAFSRCENLENIEISNSVTTIGKKAFQSCRAIVSIEIPSSVLSLGDDVFSGCDKLKMINVSESNPNFSSIDGVLFNKEQTVLIKYPSGRTEKNYEIPNTVLEIESDAMDDCPNIEYIKIPNSVETIKEDAFVHCYKLKSVVIGNSVKSIKDYAFWSDFKLREVISYNLVPPYVEEDAFPEEATTLGVLKVPEKAVEAYKAAEYWRDFKNIEALPNVAAKSVEINKDSIELKVGETAALSATVYPDNATDYLVSWSSSDESVATVSEDGVVTAVGLGSAKITATNGKVSATCEVMVNPILAETVTLSKTEMSLFIGESATLKASVLPKNTTDKSVVWSSSDETIISVSAEGEVTALAIGEATITATAVGGAKAECHVVVTNTDAIISISSDENLDVEIYSLDGKKVGTAGKVENCGNAGNVGKGLYIIRTKDGKAKKVMVR